MKYLCFFSISNCLSCFFLYNNFLIFRNNISFSFLIHLLCNYFHIKSFSADYHVCDVMSHLYFMTVLAHLVAFFLLFLNILIFLLLLYFQFISFLLFFFLFLLHECLFFQVFLFHFFTYFFHNQLSIHITILIIFFKLSDHSIFASSFLT